MKLLVVGVLIALLSVACSGSEDSASSPDVTSDSTTIPILSDAATIWCDEQRWQVVGRAAQLGLEVPPTNPSGAELDVLMNHEIASLSETLPELGRLQAELAIGEKYLALVEKFRGEWHQSGVHDADWATWRTEEPMTYVRSCAAAYELAGGPSALSGTPPTAKTSDAAAKAPPNSAADGVTTSTQGTTTSSTATTTSTPATTTSTQSATTSTLAPGRLVAGTVIACPDFIEATFRNTGGKAVKIVEIILFIEGIDEHPFGYGTGWTPTLESGDSATWRATAADLELDWIGPGLVSVGARPHTSTGDFVYAKGPNPNSSCTAVAPSTTTTEAARVDGIDVTGSRAVCSADGATFTFKIVNTGTNELTLDQVALFPYVDDSHHFFEPENWWPLPVVPAGETVTHTEDFFFGEFWTGGSIELFVVSSSGQSIVDIPCS